MLASVGERLLAGLEISLHISTRLPRLRRGLRRPPYKGRAKLRRQHPSINPRSLYPTEGSRTHLRVRNSSLSPSLLVRSLFGSVSRLYSGAAPSPRDEYIVRSRLGRVKTGRQARFRNSEVADPFSERRVGRSSLNPSSFVVRRLVFERAASPLASVAKRRPVTSPHNRYRIFVRFKLIKIIIKLN